MAVASVAAAVQVVGAIPEAVNALEAALALADRSCVIEVDNMTADSFALASHSHESGASQKPPPARVEPFDNALCSSHSTAVGQGAVGAIESGVPGHHHGRRRQHGRPAAMRRRPSRPGHLALLRNVPWPVLQRSRRRASPLRHRRPPRPARVPFALPHKAPTP